MALCVTGVSKRFGTVQAVRDVSLSVTEGRTCGLLGSNGAGKTTTMRMIMRILLPDTGQITWKGTPITDDTRNRFGYLPEERGLYPKFEVREPLMYLTELKGHSRAEAARRVDHWIRRLDLEEYVRRPAEQLSKGTSRRCSLPPPSPPAPPCAYWMSPFPVWIRSTR